MGLASEAKAEPYSGLFFVMVNAGGGWDPTSFCDPKGTLPEEVDNPGANPMNKSYLAADIAEAGNIRYAPVGGNAAFFDKYASKLLVINGLDTSTTGHDSGSRYIWSGKLAEGNPAFAALVASEKGNGLPMAFLSNGGFDLTQGLVAPTRTGNTRALTSLAFPNRSDPNNAGAFIHSDDAIAKIEAAAAARLGRRQARATLPRHKAALSTLFTARLGRGDIGRLTDFLPAQLDNSGNPLRRQAQLALAAYQAGLAVSVNLSTGGFDTHGNHDANQIPAITELLEGVDFLMTAAETAGIADKLVVVMGSDFGRTPGYNDTNGKDHWSITSMMLMGAGIRGNRVIGATDERHRALKVNRTTFQPDDSGIVLKPDFVHAELRRLAGVDQSQLARTFTVGDEGLSLFA
jgi:hypothetical protein